MRRFLVQTAWELLLLISLFWVICLLSGCRAKYFVYRAPHHEPASLECGDIDQIHVPPGCSMEKLPNGIRVICPTSTTIYKCDP